jgi:hypothetical protein
LDTRNMGAPTSGTRRAASRSARAVKWNPCHRGAVGTRRLCAISSSATAGPRSAGGRAVHPTP